ncbi:MAG: hypothetical protein CVU84_13395 [Firmicutes bacterium HGW-Firmicutes-1]|jgi:hypothetical protein|nr:MAG: hypothetical protein CVU84_13395 [Firmicutes bacterium HGW-Firmicutes-1]
MVNMTIVKIIANRILTDGINPKTGNVYVIEDITNQDYRVAVENYILENTAGV